MTKGKPGSGWCYTDGPSIRCLSCRRHGNTVPQADCPEGHHTYFRLERERNTTRRAALTVTVLKFYGGKCACCGFDDLEKRIHHGRFLQIDHIEGGGQRHAKRDQISSIYGWLKKNNFPEGFRVLCAGCNASMEPGATNCLLHTPEQVTAP